MNVFEAMDRDRDFENPNFDADDYPAEMAYDAEIADLDIPASGGAAFRPSDLAEI